MSRAADGVKRLVERPVLATALLGLLYVVVQVWWIHSSRFVGGIDVDEAGGIATALTFHRLLSTGFTPLLQSIAGVGNGPLVPLLAVPFLVVGPRTATTAMTLQPVLAAVAATAAAGITRRISGNMAAVLAGALVLCMPAIIVSSRSFQNSLGVAAFLSLAVWALIASDRCQRLATMLAFGAATGAMLLCRTMSVGFVPALAVACLIVMAWNARAFLNVALSALAAVVVAGPWWYRQWDYITGYLTENAYGDRAEYWGATSIAGRLASHVSNLARNYSLAFPLVMIVLTISILSLVSWYRVEGTVRSWPVWSRDLAAIWVVALGGYIALMSTSNLGFWFSTPLDVMLIVALIGVAARLPEPNLGHSLTRSLALILGVGLMIGLTLVDPRRGNWLQSVYIAAAIVVIGWKPTRWQHSIGVLLSLTAVATLLVSLPRVGGGAAATADIDWRHRIVNDLDELQGGNLEADIRLGSLDLSDRQRAAAEWQAASHQLVEELVDLDQQGPFNETTVGSMHLFNSNTIGIAQELYPRGGRNLSTVNTLEPPDEEIAKSLSPMADDVPRVLVVIEGRSLQFPDDRGWPRLVHLAENSGWEIRNTVPLPDGGRVAIYTHPDSIWSAPLVGVSGG